MVPYYHATYQTPVPIINCPYNFYDKLLAGNKFQTLSLKEVSTMLPAPYCYTSTWHYTRDGLDKYKHDSYKNSMP